MTDDSLYAHLLEQEELEAVAPKLTQKEIDEDILLCRLLEKQEQEESKRSHLCFMQHTWMKKDSPFFIGFHTRKICERIDRAFEDFRNGQSTYLLINVHHRAGKSDIVSRYLGPHFLGEFPSEEVMQVTYQANLAISFSSFGRNIFRSEKYEKIYPNICLSKETNKKNEWVITDKNNKLLGGKLYASGLQSGLTGSGFALGILDDYCSGRAEAESIVQRDNAWEAFTNDFMTRAAPVSIVIVLATIWHWDDISGRIKNEMQQNEYFPKFEILQFPARARDYKGEGTYIGKYLFLERFNEKWYDTQYATLGKYSAAALLDCDPQLRSGGILSTEGIVWHDKDDKTIPQPPFLKWAYIWDLAHTAKQRAKDDPDYTSGTLMAFQHIVNDPIPHLWIKHRVRIREGATKRDKIIKLNTEKAGKFVRHAIEDTVESKDAYDYIREALPEYNWEKISIQGDKATRAAPLEPIFEAQGHVHVVRGDWNDEWLDEIIKFTGSGKEHDDGVDNLSAGYIFLVGTGRLHIDDANRKALAERRKMS